MKELHVITPVKDSIGSTLDTIRAVCGSRLSVPHTYTVFDDFSTPENAARLDAAAEEYGFRTVHLSEHTDHPSPNYLLVLRMAQAEALEAEAALCIVESDVTVRPETLQALCDGAEARPDCGMAAAVTVDGEGRINYPYSYAEGWEGQVVSVRKHLSFCCTLLTLPFLRSYDFRQLDSSKDWFDVAISRQALRSGFANYLFASLPVRHRPHASRPWKQLKYTHPLRYYWLKFTRGLDKI